MTDPENAKTAEEAADLFLRLKSDPDNALLIAERDAFLERGATERKAYEAVRTAWSGVTPQTQRSRMPVIALAVALGALAFVAAEPVQIFLLADHTTGKSPRTIVSSVGDRIDLDASTSLQDLSDDATREYSVLEGAVLFDVASERRPFIVNLGPVDVSVTGTVFETAHQGDALVVSVIEGAVEVKLADETWDLSGGMSFEWSESEGANLTRIAPDDIASWRGDRLVTNGMRFDEVAAVIDRRLSGAVYVVGTSLASQPVSGIIDLADPMLALRTLAVSRDARVTDLGPFGKIVYP